MSEKSLGTEMARYLRDVWAGLKVRRYGDFNEEGEPIVGEVCDVIYSGGRFSVRIKYEGESVHEIPDIKLDDYLFAADPVTEEEKTHKRLKRAS